MLTSIVILTYNQLEYTKLCIDSIRRYTKPGTYEMIIVDNHSTDGTPEWLHEQDDLKVIYNSVNEGFPKGCNQGIEISNGDNILLLNNDTIVTYKWLENLTDCLYSSDNIGAVGPVTNNCSYYQAIKVNYNDIDQMQTFARNYNQQNCDWEERIKLIGFCLLFKKELVHKIGYLDERYTPGNFEDDDYSYRIKQCGYKLMLVRNTFIHHFGSISWKDDPYQYTELMTINAKKFYDKWGFEASYPSMMRIDLIKLLDEKDSFSGKILQYGCGSGATLLSLEKAFPHSTIEAYDTRQNSVLLSVMDKVYDHTNLPLENTYDYIVADTYNTEVDLCKIISECKAYLKTNGKLIISLNTSYHDETVEEVMNGFELSGYQELDYDTDHKINHYFVGYKSEKPQVGESRTDKISQMVEKLKKYNPEQIIHYIGTLPTNTQISVLNVIAESNFEKSNHDNVLPFLQYAHQLNPINEETIVNLVNVYKSMGENDLAQQYSEMLTNNINQHKDNRLFLIMSLHRSGSSATAGVMHQLGVSMGDNLLGPAQDNPKGFFEERSYVLLNDKLLNSISKSWDNPPSRHEATHITPNFKELANLLNTQKREFWGLKDPRTLLTFDIWKPLFEKVANITYIFVHRPFEESVKSISKRNNVPLSQSVKILSPYLENYYYYRDQLYSENADVIEVEFNDLLTDPSQFVAEINQRMGESPLCNMEKVEDFLDLKLKNF
ncbi:glycosyltransferase [Pseudalkalibacillus sp. Hm43]|uniref:glycosyltransferase n=1 Tax=Pseudalkalibacillus sp. Hm43 TaxID=3450742 RepID=UPI003F420B11